jgi:hypothetical protein
VFDDEGWDADKLETICELLEAWATASYLPLLSNDIGLLRIYGRDLTTETSYVFDHPVSPPVGGGVVSPSLPNNVAITLAWKSGLAGRSQNGRMFVPGIAESSVTNNTIGGTLATGLITAGQALIDDLDTGTRFQVIVSRRQNGVVLAEGTTTPVETAVLVDRVVDSQRRRLPGRGQ